MRPDFLNALALGLIALLALPLQAQTYPSQAIRIVQGFPPGGNADTVARLVGNEMSKSLGQPIVVEARPGAGGTIAADLVSRSAPDGYTLLLVSGGHSVAGALYRKLPYKSVDGFSMISTISFFPFIVSTRSDGNYASLQALLAAARKAPGSVSFAAAGPGATQHLVGELMASKAGVKLLYVSHRGDADSVRALMSSTVDMIITPGTAILPHVQSGTFRAIAVSGPTRWGRLPDTPTVAESGIPGYQVRSWLGMAAPAGTPTAVISRLNAALHEALKVPEVRARLEQIGGEVRGGTPKEMSELVASEIAQWNAVIDEARIERQ